MSGNVERSVFGTLSTGLTVECVSLAWPGGLEVRIITLGAAVQALFVPDAAG